MPQVLLSTEARDQLAELKATDKKAYKAVGKALRLMEADLRHPSLNTHPYSSLQGPGGEKVFEAYAQNHTPGARRIFYWYGPGKDQVTVLAVLKHPK